MATQTNNNKGSKGDQLHLFVTGATGYIGSVVVQHAVAEGHTVRGLSRNEAGDARLRELGATPVRGELTSMDVLREESTKADAVLHLAYIHDFGMDYDEVLRQDAAAVDALGAGLRGTGKALVLTSGTAVVAPDPTGRETTEDSPLSQTFILKDRIRSEEHALGLSEDDVRVTVLRLPPYVYGRGGSFFVPMLLEAATKAKASIYVDDGSLRTSDVHVDDAAALYLLAAKAKPNRQVYNGTGSTSVTLRQLAEAIGEVLQLPVRSVTRQEAETLWGPFLTGFVQFENRASNRKAVSQLGWQPKGVDMLTDIRSGSYRDLAKKLQTEL